MNANFPCRSIVALLLPCALLLIGCGPDREPLPSFPGFKSVAFPNGYVQMSIPEDYTHRLEADDTVAVAPPGDPGVTLRFNLHEVPGQVEDGDGLVEDFIDEQARAKGILVQRIGDKATITESGSHTADGVRYEMTFCQIGFEDKLVVMSAEVNDTRKEDPAVKKCLEMAPQIIASMKKY